MFALLQVLLASATIIGEAFCADLRITGVDGFINFANAVNKGTSYAGTTVLLDTDLDFTGKTLAPVGYRNSDSDLKWFQGTFDGQGHVISSLSMKSTLRFVGLFGFLNGGTTIKNIVVDDSCSIECTYSSVEASGSDPTVGGVLGWCRAQSGKCVIENSVNMASVAFRGSTGSYMGIGGIAGAISGVSYEITVKNCANYGSLVNSGTVTSNSNIGGIVGTCGIEDFKKLIQNCANYGSIDCTNSKSGANYAGGITGYSKNSKISNCLSVGKISSTGSNNGGILGYVYSSTAIEHCYWTSEAFSGSSYGSGSPTVPTLTSVSKLTSLANALNSLNPQVTSDNGWNEWFTLHLNGGKINNLEQETVVVMTRKPFPEPVKVGDTFLYWCTDANCNGKYDPKSTTLTKSSALYAIWSISSKHTVTFKSDGSVIKSESLLCGSTITYPENPSKEGHTFAGWDNDIKTVPAYDVTINAQWTVNSYTITFEPNGGSACSPITKDYGEAITLPMPTKTGYTFAYWCSDSSLATYFTGSTMPAKNMTLYAKWANGQYTITFEPNGGSACSPITKDYGETITLPTPTKTGYTFAYWCSDSGLATKYEGTTMPSENKKLYAKWTVNQYTITFESNGGSTCDPITKDYGSSFTLPTPTKTGYTFNYWCSDSALSTQYTKTTIPAKNMTLYAKWTINQYTVAFMSDGSVIKSETLNYGSTITYPDDPSKEGHTFNGWDSDIETVPAYNATINATWTVNKYTVIFDVNGGNTLPVQSKEVAYNGIYGDLPEPAKTGHSFVGWFTDKVSESEEVTRESKYNIINNQTLYAHWAINSYTITFDFNNGTTTSSLFQFNETITYPDNPERDNYTFNGWDPKPERMGAENITVKALWNETRREEKKTPTEGSEYVEIVFGKKDLSKEEAEKVIERYTDGKQFSIVKFEDGKETGETVVIVKFVDQEEANEFLDSINKYKRAEDCINYAKAALAYDVNASPSACPSFSSIFLGFLINI